MKRIVLMALLALALPLAAFAGSSVDFQNTGGSIAAIGGALTGSSDLTTVNGFPGLASSISVLYPSSLGSVTFTTPTIFGSVSLGGLFGTGGSFSITGNGTDGLPSGAIFTGSFTGGTWEMFTIGTGSSAQHQYVLSGGLTGTWESGTEKVGGVTTQVTVNAGTGYLTSCGEDTYTACTVTSVTIASGDTDLTVPEPGTLGLLGTGLVGIAGMVRRKLFGA